MRALKTCSQPGCPELTDSGRCTEHRKQADRTRGTRQQRGYGVAHTNRFRPGVLRKHPLCVCKDQGHGHGLVCLLPSSVADHHPLDRRELVARGLDPNDPQYGRGLCASCHNRWTAQAQPGGFNAR